MKSSIMYYRYLRIKNFILLKVNRQGESTRWIDHEELVKDVRLKGVFESFNHVFDSVFGSWNGN